MCKNRNLGLAASRSGINYYILYSSIDSDRPFGIMATMELDTSDTNLAENLFFTKEEALQCCLWLAENQVFPVTLCEVLENLYSI